MSSHHPLFRDGERLTAQRLNDAFGYLDDHARRAQLGTTRPGVVVGYELSVDVDGPEVALRIDPGLAIDGAGRFLVSSAAQRITIADIERETGALAVGSRVLVQVKGSDEAGSSTDPCAQLRPQVIDNAPLFHFEPAGQRVLSVAPSAMPAWSDLSASARDGHAVTLGSITIRSDSGGFTVSMAERQGVTARVDGLQNTRGQRAIEFTDADGNAQVKLLARTFGDDVTATRIGAGHASAASFAPSDGRVLLLNGGSGALAAGLGGLAATAVELAAGSAPVDRAGLPLEMAPGDSGGAGDVAVRARRVGSQGTDLALGVSAAAAYDINGVTVVPVAFAGMVATSVRVGDGGLALGAPLRIANGSELAVIDRPPATVVARAAQVSERTNTIIDVMAWVNSPYLLASPVIG